MFRLAFGGCFAVSPDRRPLLPGPCRDARWGGGVHAAVCDGAVLLRQRHEGESDDEAPEQGGRREGSGTDHDEEERKGRGRPEVFHPVPSASRREGHDLPRLEVSAQGLRPLALHPRHQAGKKNRGQRQAVQLRRLRLQLRGRLRKGGGGGQPCAPPGGEIRMERGLGHKKRPEGREKRRFRLQGILDRQRGFRPLEGGVLRQAREPVQGLHGRRGQIHPGNSHYGQAHDEKRADGALDGGDVRGGKVQPGSRRQSLHGAVFEKSPERAGQMKYLMASAFLAALSLCHCSPALALSLHGFVECAGGIRLKDDPAQARDATLGEGRLQVELSQEGPADSRLFFKADLIWDGVEERGDADLRELYLDLSHVQVLDIRAGRQILTWGTGDLVFINDLFPKDFVSFFVGRSLEYLKVGSDAVKFSLYPGPFALDLVAVPHFTPSEIPEGERI